jgi:tetratricopeptide (TPR) repeat protein
MANDQGSSSGAPEPAEDIHNLVSIINSTQSSIEQLFVSSRVPVEEEVKLRLDFAASQIQYGAFYQQASSLELAAEHLDTALRHMSNDSHQRPEALLLYCRVEFERHTLSRSRHALDMSVKHGREARLTANALRLLDNNTTLYIDILTELGHVLSHRNALSDNDNDLDESIACRRQILACTAADSEKHLLTLNNLASVLHRRYQDRGIDEDRDEAMNLLHRLLASTPPESQLYASGITQLGFMAARKYEKTGLLDDLDNAIQQLRTSETFVAEGIMQDGRDSLFQQLISLYERRHQHTFDVADKRQVVHYSNLAFNMLSPDHKLRPSRLYQLLMSSHQYSSMSDSTVVFETTMAICKEAMSTMPANFERREDFSAMYGKMLGRLYAATGKLEHLDDLMANVIISTHQFGAMAVAGHTELDVPVQGGLLAVKGLLGLVRRLKSTPP